MLIKVETNVEIHVMNSLSLPNISKVIAKCINSTGDIRNNSNTRLHERLPALASTNGDTSNEPHDETCFMRWSLIYAHLLARYHVSTKI